jgi:hypothetical protein
VVSPELADVLSAIIQRIRQPDGSVPLAPVYDRYECVWRPPSPVLFQRRFPSECRAISDTSLREMLDEALAHTGLKDLATGQPLHYTPYDFRRIFITDAAMSGLPPHIAQVIAATRILTSRWAIRPSTPTRPSSPTWHSWPGGGHSGPPMNTGSPAKKNGRNSSATSSAGK